MRLPGEVGKKAVFPGRKQPGKQGAYWGQVYRGLLLRALISAALIAVVMPAVVNANAGIARAVETFCAPQPAAPSVASCSTCHSTANARSVNDLTTVGQWAKSSATFNLFCPLLDSSVVSEPDPLPSVLPAPTRGFSPGSGSTGGSTGIGMGRGAVLN